MTHVRRAVQRAGERFRGGDPEAGIRTWHAFSFSGFYDPDNVRFGPLAACNEENLAPGAGFAEHPHRDVEIVTWVIEGELTHEDSAGHRTVVRAGDLQRLSAGEGVRHAERNLGHAPLRFVQMWLTPSEWGGEPSYEVVRDVPPGHRYPLARAEAVLHVFRSGRPGERVSVPDAPWIYVHVARGAVRIGEDELREGDAVRLFEASGVTVEVVASAEWLVWEMHAEPRWG